MTLDQIRKQAPEGNEKIKRRRRSYGLTKEKAEKISINTMKIYLDKYKPLN